MVCFNTLIVSISWTVQTRAVEKAMSTPVSVSVCSPRGITVVRVKARSRKLHMYLKLTHCSIFSFITGWGDHHEMSKTLKYKTSWDMLTKTYSALQAEGCLGVHTRWNR